jgi:hypothetical protein
MAFLPLRAQWTADTETNTTVATSATGDMQSVGTSDGRTWVAFWHDLPAPKYYEMRLQLLDQSGNRVFGEEGMVVDDQVPMSSFTTTWSITVDRQDNVYIGFNGTDGGNPVIVHKIAPDGTQLWGNAGINPGTGFDVKVLPLSNGEVVIGWLPASKGLLQKVSADGVAQWATPVTIEPLVSTHRTSAGEMAELSNGDFMVILHDRGGFSPSSLPYAQRYDGSGAAAWTSPVALTTTYFTSFNRRYALYQDVDTLYFGYAGAQGIQPHGFLQRIDPDGTLPWGADGSDFSTQTTSFERDVQIAYTPGSDVVWAICEYSDPSQSQVGEYVQKFDKKTGERLLGNLGKAVFPIGDVYISHQGKLQLVNDRPVFLVSNGNSNGVFAKDLLVVYLDENGGFAWPEHTRQASNNPSGVKSRIQLNASFEGRVVAAWAEDRPDSAAIRPYAQRIDIDIACVPPTAGFGYTVSDLSATFTNIAIGVDSVAWDFGDGTTGIGADIIHVYTLEGNYTVCEYVFNECGVDTFCRNLVLMTNAAISLEQNYHLNLSPNPSLDHSILSIDMPAPANLTYRLFSSSGRNLFDRSVFLSAGEQSVFMDTKNLPAGNYFLVVTVNGKSATLSMVR